MNSLDQYMLQDIHEYLNICDKIKCKLEYNNLCKETHDDNRFYYGCEHNIMELIKYDLSLYCNGTTDDILNINDKLNYVCSHGYKELVEIMMKIDGLYWRHGYGGACRSGNVEIMEMMKKRGAQWCTWCGKIVYPVGNHNKK